MEKKTAKKLLLSVLGTLLGVVMFVCGLNFELPIVGLLGFVCLDFGGLAVFDYTIQGVAETIRMKRYWKDREYVKNVKDSLKSKEEIEKEETLSSYSKIMGNLENDSQKNLEKVNGGLENSYVGKNADFAKQQTNAPTEKTQETLIDENEEELTR